MLEKIFSRRTNTKETISEKTADGAPEQQTNKGESLDFSLGAAANYQIFINVRLVFVERHEASDKDNENQSPAKKRFLLSYTRKPPTLLENILSRRPKETISINADGMSSIKSTVDFVNEIYEYWR